MHLVSAGGQHHLISQPAHVALIQAVAPTPGPTPVSVLPSSTPSTTPAPTGLSLPLAANQGEAPGLPTYLALLALVFQGMPWAVICPTCFPLCFPLLVSPVSVCHPLLLLDLLHLLGLLFLFYLALNVASSYSATIHGE